MLPHPPVPTVQISDKIPKLEVNENIDPLHSIVSLYRKNGDFFCSGVVIGKNYLLTAAHCLNETGLIDKADVTVINSDGSIKVIGKPVAINMVMDWGLVQGDFSKIPSSIVNEASLTPPKMVLACGHPWGAKSLTCQPAVITNNDAFQIKTDGGMVWPGMSGGPVFNPDTGLLIGINTAAYPLADYGGGAAFTPTIGILACFKIAD